MDCASGSAVIPTDSKLERIDATPGSSSPISEVETNAPPIFFERVPPGPKDRSNDRNPATSDDDALKPYGAARMIASAHAASAAAGGLDGADAHG